MELSQFWIQINTKRRENKQEKKGEKMEKEEGKGREGMRERERGC